MGLLSEPEGGGGAWARAWGGAGAGAGAAAALAWLLALAHPGLQLHARTYFSENALLPGLVRSDLPPDVATAADTIHTQLLRELNDKYGDSQEMPVSWLVAKMSQLQLETHVHNYTLTHPLNHKQTWTGVNVYGVVRGPGPGLEAVLVTVPYRPPASHLRSSLGGLALALAFAAHARERRYWAKDLVLVVSQHEQAGLQAWLEAYHAPPAPRPYTRHLAALGGGAGGGAGAGEAPDTDTLPARAGHIQAAVNIDISAPDITHVIVRGSGLNGASCNLDLLNLVRRLCDKSDVPHVLSETDVRGRTRARSLVHYLRNLLTQIVERASGAPSGNHGLAQKYGIEGVTIEGGGGGGGGGGGVGWRRLLLVLEGTMRSLNNLLERFHQSYFLYILLDVDTFLSVGQYMVSVCVCCAALLLRALALAPAPALAPALVAWLALHAASLALMLCLPLAVSAGTGMGWSTEGSVLCWCCCGSVLAGAAGRAARGAGGAGGAGGAAGLRAGLVSLAALLAGVALLNPPAGLLLAAVYTPAALLSGRRGAGWAVLAAQPLVGLGLGVLGAAAGQFAGEGAGAVLVRAASGLAHAVTQAAVDYYMYGNWTWPLAWCGLLPVWTLLWHASVSNDKLTKTHVAK